MPWKLSEDLQKQVKDDKEYSESELFESKKCDSSSESEDVENVEGFDSPEHQRTVDDDENIR